MLCSMFLNAAEVFANVARKMFQRMLEAMISGAIAAHKAQWQPGSQDHGQANTWWSHGSESHMQARA